MVIQEKACKLLWPAAHISPGSLSCPWQKENLLNVLSSSLLYLLTSSTSVLPSWAVYIGKSVPLFWRKFYRWSFLCVFVACECFAAVRLTRNDVFSCNFDAQKIYASANSGHGLWAGVLRWEAPVWCIREMGLQLPSLRPSPILLLCCGAGLFSLQNVCVHSYMTRNWHADLDLLLLGIISWGLCGLSVDFWSQTSQTSGFNANPHKKLLILCRLSFKTEEKNSFRSNIWSTIAERQFHSMLVNWSWVSVGQK